MLREYSGGMRRCLGLVIGWRPDASLPAVIGGFALFLLFSYALSWGCGCLGIVSKGPESAQGVGLVLLFPLAIVSNGLVPPQHMPAVLRFIADWNPVSAVTAAARHLWGNPNPSATIHAWPMQQPAGRRARVAGGDRVLEEAGQAGIAGASPRQMISIARSSVTGAAGNVAAA